LAAGEADVLNKWKLPAVVFMGKWLVFMPENKLDIDFWHGQYMEELKSLFKRNKGKYAAESNNAELVML
jgi:hypothetical protein